MGIMREIGLMVAAVRSSGSVVCDSQEWFVALAPIAIPCSRSISLAKLLNFWILLCP